jgi:nucleoside-diphosphate-sugar epimerase
MNLWSFINRMEIFVTGSTGLLGSKLIGSLIRQQDISKVYTLIRDPEKASELKNQINDEVNKVELVVGDVSIPNFGFDQETLSKLKNVSKFYHLAASVHLGDSDKAKKLLSKTNIFGTQNTLNFVKLLPNLDAFYFVSSAYACGNCNRTVEEIKLDIPQNFRNPYEESKWGCEDLVLKAFIGSKINYFIIRPSILLDDLGNANKVSNHTIYLFSKIIYKHSQVKSYMKLIGNPESHLNFVFVNDLVRFLLTIKNEEKSQVFNFINNEDISIKDLLYAIEVGLHMESKLKLVDDILSSEFNETELSLNNLIKPFIPYLKIQKTSWNNENTIKIINDRGILIQSKSSILENISSYCELLRKNEL